MPFHIVKDRDAKAAPNGFHGAGDGLWLDVRGGSRLWWYRYGATKRKVPLGSYPEVSLADARKGSVECNGLRAKGIDPQEHFAAKKAESVAAELETFDKVAAAYIPTMSKANEWTAKTEASWTSTLATYASPVFGTKSVRDITRALVLEVLEPLGRREIGRLVRMRVEAILQHAIDKGWSAGPNPCQFTTRQLKSLFGKAKKVVHHAGPEYADMPEVMAELRKLPDTGPAALEFAVLTVARAGEACGAQWSEIDGDVWTVPADRMKGRKEHKVPLSDAALVVLERMAERQDRRRPDGFIFRGDKAGKPITVEALRQAAQKVVADDVDVTSHGFRGTFKTWATEVESFPAAVVEMALAHTQGKLDAAYQHGKLLAKRRKLMEAWADHCVGKPTADVIDIATRRDAA